MKSFVDYNKVGQLYLYTMKHSKDAGMMQVDENGCICDSHKEQERYGYYDGVNVPEEYMILTEEVLKIKHSSIFKAESRQMVCFLLLIKEEFYMIRLYVASEKLVKEEKDICVRLVLPVEENEIWIALQKAEMESLDDCEISDVECDVEEAQEFLCSLEISKANIFELNVFAGLLSALPEDELMLYRKKLKDQQPKSLEEAIYEI